MRIPRVPRWRGREDNCASIVWFKRKRIDFPVGFSQLREHITFECKEHCLVGWKLGETRERARYRGIFKTGFLPPQHVVCVVVSAVKRVLVSVLLTKDILYMGPTKKRDILYMGPTKKKTFYMWDLQKVCAFRPLCGTYKNWLHLHTGTNRNDNPSLCGTHTKKIHAMWDRQKQEIDKFGTNKNQTISQCGTYKQAACLPLWVPLSPLYLSTDIMNSASAPPVVSNKHISICEFLVSDKHIQSHTPFSSHELTEPTHTTHTTPMTLCNLGSVSFMLEPIRPG